MKTFLLFLINQILSILCIITFPIHINPLDRPKIKLNINNKDIRFYTHLNTYLQYPLFEDRLFIEKFQDQESKNITIKFNNNDIVCSEYITDFEIENITISNLKFLIFPTGINEGEEEGIGLSYKFQDESYSLTHNLYKNSQIEHLLFAFSSNLTSEDEIMFGGIPNSSHLNMTYKGYINVNDTLSSWGSNLTSIVYENKTFEVNLNAVINTGYYEMLLSPKIYTYFLTEVLADAIKENNCYEQGYNHYIYIECIEKLEIFSNKIQVNFLNTRVNLTIQDLFLFKNDKWFMLVDTNTLDQNHNSNIILGYSFLRLFNFSIFDYENKQVQFYSDKPIIDMISIEKIMDTTKITIKKLLYVFCSAICIINNLIFLSYRIILLKNQYNDSFV